MFGTRPQIHSGTVDLVSRHDPAIDRKKSDIDKYLETGSLAHLVFSGEPTLFRMEIPEGPEMRKIRRIALDSTEGRAFVQELQEELFFQCLRRVTPWLDKDGVQLAELPKDRWEYDIPTVLRCGIGSLLYVISTDPLDRGEDAVPLRSAPQSSEDGASSNESD